MDESITQNLKWSIGIGICLCVLVIVYSGYYLILLTGIIAALVGFNFLLKGAASKYETQAKQQSINNYKSVALKSNNNFKERSEELTNLYALQQDKAKEVWIEKSKLKREAVKARIQSQSKIQTLEHSHQFQLTQQMEAKKNADLREKLTQALDDQRSRNDQELERANLEILSELRDVEERERAKIQNKQQTIKIAQIKKDNMIKAALEKINTVRIF